MASGTCKYSFEWSPLGYSKWPSRSAPVSRSAPTTSSSVGMMCMVSSLAALSCPSSVGPAPRKHVRDAAQNDLPVQRQRPVIDVLHVHLHPALEIHLVAAGTDPQAGQAPAHAQPPPLPGLVTVHLARHGGTRAYQRHVAAQHIPQLGPF